MHPRPRRIELLLLAGLTGMALLGACGSGAGSSASTTVPVTSPSVSTTAAAPGPAQLRAVVVQPADLPPGWTARPPNPSTSQAADSAAFAQCVGAPNTASDVVSIGYSPEFVNGTSVIASTASSFKSPADIQADTAALTNAKAAACFVQVLKARLTATLPKGATVKSVTFKIAPGANGGPDNVIATGTKTMAFTASGHTVTLNDAVVFLAGPRIEAHIDFYSEASPISAQVKAAVINNVSARVANGS